MTIEVSRLSKQYGRRLIVDDISFSCPAGTITGLLGQNGAGKSTTLRCLLGLTHQTSGTATFSGRSVGSLARPQTTVGSVLDAGAHHPGRSTEDTIRLIANLVEVPRSRVDDLLRLVGLEAARHKMFRSLSLGMKQRLAIAIALLGQPRYLVLDEPLNGLDIEGVGWFREIVQEFARDGGTVLVSSHMLAELQIYADRVVTIHEGRVVDDREMDDLPMSSQLTIRSSNDRALIPILIRSGFNCHKDMARDRLVVDGKAEEVAQIARDNNLLLYEIYSESTRALEEHYLDVVKRAEEET